MRIARSLVVCLLLIACGNSEPHTVASENQSAREASQASSSVLAEAAPTSTGVLETVVVGSSSRQSSDSISGSRRSAIVTAAARVAPAVVSVNVVRRQRRVARTVWEQFFVPRGSELVQGFGSGFTVTIDGLVITNQHVIEDADEIVVTTTDGVDYEATLLGEDPFTDIAVLQIDGDGLAIAPLGRSRDLDIGEWVVAIGNPYAYLLGNTDPTVTAGVVSAVGRDLIPASDDAGLYVGMIQTDAAINPGNSGGPLVNALGEVVGVNSSIFSNSGGSIGIGFAIPIERALRVADELREYGAVRRAWVGLDVAGPDRLGDWKRAGGLEIVRVAEDSPADRAGLRGGDVIIEAANQNIRTFLDWEAVKLDVGPGDRVAIDYLRGNRQLTTTLDVEDLPTSRAERVSALGDMELITLTPAIRQERNIQREHGALIFNLGDNLRQRTGLRPGDLIFAINRQLIEDADEVTEIFRSVRGNTLIRLFVERGGSMFIRDLYVR